MLLAKLSLFTTFLSLVTLILSGPAYALPGTLAAKDPTSPINIRYAPTTEAELSSQGLTGDSVQILTAAPGEGNYTWYYIRFVQTDVEGWIRQDLIQVPVGNVVLGQIQDGNYGIGPVGVGLQVIAPRYSYYDEEGDYPWAAIADDLYYVRAGVVFDRSVYWCLLDQYPETGMAVCTPQGWQEPA